MHSICCHCCYAHIKTILHPLLPCTHQDDTPPIVVMHTSRRYSTHCCHAHIKTILHPLLPCTHQDDTPPIVAMHTSRRYSTHCCHAHIKTILHPMLPCTHQDDTPTSIKYLHFATKGCSLWPTVVLIQSFTLFSVIGIGRT